MFDQLMSFFIPNAYAETAPVTQGAEQSSYSFMIIAAIMLAFLYFTVWRPQSKRAKEQQALLTSLAKGDEIITIGGILGRIVKIGDHYLTISVGNNVEMAIQKSSVASVLPKGTLKSIE